MGASFESGVIPMQQYINVLTACAPILVALVGIIPTIISNRKKTQATIEKVQDTLDKHIKENDDEKARNQRYRILRFYDEICEGRRHSESHFEDILDDCSEYRKYTATHPDFKNNRGEIAMEEIQETYRRVKHDGGFLMKGA